MTMELTGEIEYRSGKVSVTLPSPMLITEAVQKVGLLLNASCAGQGTCGGCAVDLYAGTYFQESRGEFIAKPTAPIRVLGCQTRIVQGPFLFSIPPRSLVESGGKVVTDFVIQDVSEINPSIREITLSLPSPTLGNAHGCYEEIVRELKEHHHLEVKQASLSALRQLPSAIKAEKPIQLTLAWIHEGWELLAISSEMKKHFGLAVDIGTTTVAMSLIDFADGKIVDTVSCYNQQIQVADDVTSRIVAAGTAEGLHKLQQLIIQQTLNPLVQTLCREHTLDTQSILRMVVSGNTVMWNLFLGIDPISLGVVPFQPACRKPDSVRAKELGLAIYPDAQIDVVPSISAYVGGDIVSDIVSSHLEQCDGLSLLIDIGTNGEIVLTDGRNMFVTACAAGPAFEGLRISHGMRASVGAIERIAISKHGDDCRIQTIGETKPVGICGSGLIDFVAEGFRSGIITPAGRFERSLLGKCPRLRLKMGSAKMLEYVLVDRRETEDVNHDISVTEKDIETLLQAKAAIFAAIYLLLKRMGKTFADLNRVYLAGGFARYINIENAITLGLLPEIDTNRYTAIGNASLAGAYLALVDKTLLETLRRISDQPKVVELNLDPEFQDEFTSALFLPNMQESLFPKTLNI